MASFVVYSFLVLWVIVFVCLLAFDLRYKASSGKRTPNVAEGAPHEQVNADYRR